MKAFTLLFLCLGLLSCASYQSKIFESRKLMKQGQVTEALGKLKALSDEPGRDQLLYLMDYATALQVAGQYKESSQVFLKADKLVDLNDYHSVTNVVSATLGGEEMVQYKGESYEKFLINTLNAINYVMMGQYDDALVEARRINEKITKMKMDGRDPYELSSFARYLAAILWETEKKYDDSYIEYEGAYNLDATNPLLPEDLLRSSKMSRRQEAYKKWKSEFPQVKEDSSWYDKGNGELVVIYQQGWGAEKRTRSGTYRFPMLVPVGSDTQSARVLVSGKDEGKTKTVYDIDQVSIQTLEKDFGALVARRVGGIAAKAVVSDQIRQKNQLLGDLTWIAMNLADRADLRQWSTLPSTIQIDRVLLKPGKYKLEIQGLDGSGSPTADRLEVPEITIKAGQKTFVNWRSLR
ncbi:MAG: hypothetical protein COT73_07885 [Bdellovibrio sp. CG10_big_fil_rev_8_21_14_0_10_47_8]|nr:MAG: hypothetical protein COT73_07885 [Bdellovibrio sp. CG10_big_fil_rev_8_21_14_0_10_47_8]